MGDSKFYDFVLQCLKLYCEQNLMCVTLTKISDITKEFIAYLKDNGITTKSSEEEILEVFLAVFLDKIDPTRPMSRLISKFVCEYCLKWSEMTIVTNNGTNVVRPPYVLNENIKDGKRNLPANKENWKKTVKSNLSGSRKTTREEYDFQDYGGETIGKAHPDTIVNYLSKHCADKDASGMQAELDNYCIGADCTGFVSRAIAYVMEKMKWDKLIQYKTIGPNDDDYTKPDGGRKKLNLCEASKLNTAATFFKFYMNDSSEAKYDHIYFKKSNKIIVETNQIEDHLLDEYIIGSRLIYRFKVVDKKVEWDLINKDFNRDDEPRITSLRPGDIVTMANNDTFSSSFHIAIICKVGVDKTGPYFITADSSSFTLKSSPVKEPTSFMLASPNASDYVNFENLGVHQIGNGVRYVLHRGFDFFSYKKVIAFRRPYAFDLFYRERIKKNE